MSLRVDRRNLEDGKLEGTTCKVHASMWQRDDDAPRHHTPGQRRLHI